MTKQKRSLTDKDRAYLDHLATTNEAAIITGAPMFCCDCGTELDDGDCPVCDPDPSDDTDIFDDSWD